MKILSCAQWLMIVVTVTVSLVNDLYAESNMYGQVDSKAFIAEIQMSKEIVARNRVFKGVGKMGDKLPREKIKDLEERTEVIETSSSEEESSFFGRNCTAITWRYGIC